MFGMGMTEVLLILVVALLVVGPKKLPDMAKSLGKGISQFRKAADDIKQEFSENETYQDIKGLNKSFHDTLDEVNPKKMLEEVNPLVEPKEPKLDLSGRHALMEDIQNKPGEAGQEASVEVAQPGQGEDPASPDKKLPDIEVTANPSPQDRKES